MRYRRLAIAAAMVAVPLTTLTSANATTVCSTAGTSFTDCGFEAGAMGPWGINYSSTPAYQGFVAPAGSGWTFAASSGLENSNPWGGPAPIDSQAAFVQDYSGTAPGVPAGDGSISQTIATGWDTTSMYTIKVAAAARPYNPSTGLNDGASSSFKVQVDGIDLAAPTTVTNNTSWTDYSFSFSPNSTSPHTITIVAVPTAQNDSTTFLDNIRITKPFTAASCKDGGWQTIGTYKNQGDCVSFYATGGKNLPRA